MQRKTIESIFSTITPLYFADLIAVKMNNGNYYIYKNKHAKLKGFVTVSQFTTIVGMSSSPIILHESYIDMESINKQKALMDRYHKERADLMERAMKYRLASDQGASLATKTNAELNEYIEVMEKMFSHM